ncbi:hypothetical protein TNCV_1523561 [Trichonephila clavipes]|nr:hypothetical protein TNCV_1523561 [Trichonephila clavipes]
MSTTHNLYLYNKTSTYVIFESRQFVFCLRKKIGDFGNVTEEIVDLARQINLEDVSDGVQELLESHNQDLTIDELTHGNARAKARH